MEIKPSAGSGRSSLVIGEDGALYFSSPGSALPMRFNAWFYDESSETYLSTLLGDFGQDVWPAVILDATSNAPAAAVSPLREARFTSSLNQRRTVRCMLSR